MTDAVQPGPLPASQLALRPGSPFELQRPLSLAIGIFDGVHLGHQAVVESSVQAARNLEGRSAVLTFWPHPSRFFRPDDPTRLLMPLEVKQEVLFSFGLDGLIWKTFDADLAHLEADAFVPYLRRHLPNLRTLHVGENFRFGAQRRGDIALMIATARPLGVEVFSCERLKHNGLPISSSRLREDLQQGAIETANLLLGYPYFARGPVVPGRQLGRNLGFPTLNIRWEPELSPRYGVYAVRVGNGAGRRYPGVANYGLRPTIDSANRVPLLEVHLLGDCPFTTGDSLKVEWLHFLRPEQTFPSLDALRAQIGRDRESAREKLGATPAPA